MKPTDASLAAFLTLLLGAGWPTSEAWADVTSRAGLSPPSNWASQQPSQADPGLLCRRAVAIAGRDAGVPDHLMAAIARIESGRRSADGRVNPWPWSINVEGTDHVYQGRDEAIAAVRQFQAQGARSIDVGCMQVNLLHHPNAFASLEVAFDPAANAGYAARFLTQLYAQTGSWPRATAFYHSATPELGEPYQKKVAAVLEDEAAADLALLGGPGGRAQMASITAAPARPGAGALMLGNRADAARVIPLAEGGMARSLDAYRAAPIRVAARDR